MYNEVFCRNAPLIYANQFDQVYYSRYKILQIGVELEIGPLSTDAAKSSRSEYLPVAEGQKLMVDINNVGTQPVVGSLLIRAQDGGIHWYPGDDLWSGFILRANEQINQVIEAPWTGKYALWVDNNDPTGQSGVRPSSRLILEVYGSLSLPSVPPKNPYKI